MITQEDIDRFREMEAKIPKKLLFIDTIQFFKIEISADLDSEYYLQSEECRKKCADHILSQVTDLRIDHETKPNKNGDYENG